MATMGAHGASLIAFESAGSVARSNEILNEWGDAGQDGDVVAAGPRHALPDRLRPLPRRRLRGRRPASSGNGRRRLATTAAAIAWLGPVAAAADFLQNVSLALVLAGHVAQPWPRISAVAGSVTTSLAAIAAVFALGGMLATRGGGTGLRPRRP